MKTASIKHSFVIFCVSMNDWRPIEEICRDRRDIPYIRDYCAQQGYYVQLPWYTSEIRNEDIDLFQNPFSDFNKFSRETWYLWNYAEMWFEDRQWSEVSAELIIVVLRAFITTALKPLHSLFSGPWSQIWPIMVIFATAKVFQWATGDGYLPLRGKWYSKSFRVGWFVGSVFLQFYVLVTALYYGDTFVSGSLVAAIVAYRLVRWALKGLTYEEKKIFNPETNRQETVRYYNTDSVWKNRLLRFFGLEVGEVAIMAPKPFTEVEDWNRQLYKNMSKGSTVPRMPATPESGAMNFEQRVLYALEDLAARISRLEAGEVKPEKEVAPPAYEVCQSVTMVKTREEYTTDEFSFDVIRFLDERSNMDIQSGTVMFNSKAAASVLRVVSVVDGKEVGWVSSFKIGQDKIGTVRHAHGVNKPLIKVGQPILDERGMPVYVCVPLEDGRKARFNLVPYYISTSGSKDFMLCHIPVKLRSAIPGLKTRAINPDTDDQIGIMGFPIHTDVIQFDAGKVSKDGYHLAGSMNGVSGSPILVQGRTAIGVHIGKSDGDQLKQFHPFTREDLEAIKLPAPATVPCEIEIIGEVKEKPAKEQSGAGDYRDGKKKNRRHEKTFEIEYGSDDEVFMDDTEYDHRENVTFERAKPVTIEELKILMTELITQSGASKNPTPPPPVPPVETTSSEETPPPSPKTKKKKVKRVPPCPVIAQGYECKDPKCKFGHELRQNQENNPGQNFQAGPAPTGPSGAPNSVRSMA